MIVLKALVVFLMEIMETIVFVGSLFIVVYLFIMQPNQIKGASMEPTFTNGNYIFTSKVTYKMRQPKQGDIVVFHSIRNPDIEYIKRIIALPGDTVLIQNQEVFVNGTQLIEPYISEKTTLIPGSYVQENVALTIPEGHYFVMGDNRPRSSDSREFGPITLDSIVGQVFFRYFPVDKMGNIENPLSQALKDHLVFLYPGVHS